MSSLIKDFQRDILQSQKPTSELLRTAKAISIKLGLDNVAEWIAAEINGYTTEKVPSYRFFTGGQLQVLNPYHGWRPAGRLQAKFPIFQSVSQLEALNSGKKIVLPLARNQHYQLEDDDGLGVNDWQQQVELSTVQLKGILDSIRDKLLDWSLELEKRGITGENMSFDEKERKSAQGQVFNIQHFTGVLGDVSHSSVQVYDYSSLHQILKQQNVPQEERNKLENIMDELKAADLTEKKSLLEKGKAWVVKKQEFLGASVSVIKKALGIDVV